jgi:hypothetical protein
MWTPGINLVIGANGTGKSHRLKLLCCLRKAGEPDPSNGLEEHGPYQKRLAHKISRVFRPVGGACVRLLRRRRGRDTAATRLSAEDAEIAARITTTGNVFCDANSLPDHAPAVFIPPGGGPVGCRLSASRARTGGAHPR